MNNSSENHENEKIASPYAELRLPRELEEKTLRLLQENRLLTRTSWYKSTLAKLALVLVILACGIFTWNILKPEKLVSAADPGKQYMLLLYNTEQFVEDASHVKEYGEWLHQLRNSGNLADGEELDENGWMLASQEKTESREVRNQYGTISGFFIINAASRDQALSIASTCPHLKYKGAVEVKEVIKH